MHSFFETKSIGDADIVVAYFDKVHDEHSVDFLLLKFSYFWQFSIWAWICWSVFRLIEFDSVRYCFVRTKGALSSDIENE